MFTGFSSRLQDNCLHVEVTARISFKKVVRKMFTGKKFVPDYQTIACKDSSKKFFKNFETFQYRLLIVFY